MEYNNTFFFKKKKGLIVRLFRFLKQEVFHEELSYEVTGIIQFLFKTPASHQGVDHLAKFLVYTLSISGFPFILFLFLFYFIFSFKLNH